SSEAETTDLASRIVLLPEKASSSSPATMATEIRELDLQIRKDITEIGDAITANFLDDLAHFVAEPNITQEMMKIYVGIRFGVLVSNGFGPSDATPNAPKKTDDQISAEIDAALNNPIMQPVADYLEYSRIGLKAGDRITVETDVPDPKE